MEKHLSCSLYGSYFGSALVITWKTFLINSKDVFYSVFTLYVLQPHRLEFSGGIHEAQVSIHGYVQPPPPQRDDWWLTSLLALCCGCLIGEACCDQPCLCCVIPCPIPCPRFR
ncbi:unnamed protein product [Angiostrongylus costaricensis]|uniref:CYSTM domain-containing protein n=1 Tax=Angiostrongylus costaricensis TaxID=334426 RepID=A0A0R3PAG4_ANGCS|nr:unnamed protein product [Angiostrongylus costaricensis]